MNCMQPYSLALNIIGVCWLIFVVIWAVAAVSTKRTIYRETRGQRLRYWVLLVIAYFLLFYGGRLPFPLNLRIVPHVAPTAWAAAVLDRSGLRTLGQSCSRAQLERCCHTQRRTRTG